MSLRRVLQAMAITLAVTAGLVLGFVLPPARVAIDHPAPARDRELLVDPVVQDELPAPADEAPARRREVRAPDFDPE